jgi:hypothetical protein
MGPYSKQKMFYTSELNVDETNNAELWLVDLDISQMLQKVGTLYCLLITAQCKCIVPHAHRKKYVPLPHKPLSSHPLSVIWSCS